MANNSRSELGDKGSVQCREMRFWRRDDERFKNREDTSCSNVQHEPQEKDMEFLEIVPNKSVFLDISKDPNEPVYLDISNALHNVSNVNGVYKVFDESVAAENKKMPSAGLSVCTTTTKCAALNSKQHGENAMLNQDGHSKDDNIFQKLEHAQKLAETKIREGVAAVTAEVVRLRELQVKTKQHLQAQCTSWKNRFEALARVEAKNRLTFKKTLQLVTNQKLRAEYIGNQANNQCAALSRENARLQEELKAARMKLASVDAERQEFRVQLTTLRGTLSLLSREPAPKPLISCQPASNYPDAQFTPTASNYIASVKPRSEEPQIYPSPVFPNRPESPGQRSPAPAWVIPPPRKREAVSETATADDDVPKPSNEDAPKSLLEGHANSGAASPVESALSSSTRSFDVVSPRAAEPEVPTYSASEPETAYESDFEVLTYSASEAEQDFDDEDDYSSVFEDSVYEDCLTCPPTPQHAQEKAPCADACP